MYHVHNYVAMYGSIQLFYLYIYTYVCRLYDITKIGIDKQVHHQETSRRKPGAPYETVTFFTPTSKTNKNKVSLCLFLVYQTLFYILSGWLLLSLPFVFLHTNKKGKVKRNDNEKNIYI